MAKVLISDKLSESAVDIFKKNKIEASYQPGISKEEILKIIHEYDGLAIRSDFQKRIKLPFLVKHWFQS